jgi:hypothetical protein
MISNQQKKLVVETNLSAGSFFMYAVLIYILDYPIFYMFVGQENIPEYKCVRTTHNTSITLQIWLWQTSYDRQSEIRINGKKSKP